MVPVRFGLTNAVDVDRSFVLADGSIIHVTTNVNFQAGLWAQHHSADGEPLGPMKKLGTNGIPGGLFDFSLAAAPYGGYFILAQSASGSGVGLIADEVFLRKIGADGNPDGPFRQANSISTDFQTNAHL